MPYTYERLGELLVHAGVITQLQLDDALSTQRANGRKLGQVLVESGVVTEELIAATLADQKGLTHVRLSTSVVDPEIAGTIPLRVARRHSVVPVSLDGDVLLLAMADPLNIEAVDDVAMRTGREVSPLVATQADVDWAIDRYIAEADAMSELTSDREVAEVEQARGDEDDGAAVVRLINQILRQAVAEGASDIHFQPGASGVRVRYRIDGVLRDATTLPRTSQSELLSRVKVMAELDITERRRPQDGRISLTAQGRALDVRVATLPTPRGEAITLRLLDSGVAFKPLESVGLSASDLMSVADMLRHPYGVVFVAGPTGSGKSTTLYAALSRLNEPGKQIITVEDPIEYTMDGVTQVAVNQRIGLTFAAGLRTILRSDPDIVMIGEVRDPETAETAVRAALTGHLVLTSIHTNDAPSALTRLSDMGVPPYITSSALIGVIAQRLVRVLCPACKREATHPEERLRAAGLDPGQAASATIFDAVGCDECSMTGYRGRMGVFEVMRMDDELRRLFLANASAVEIGEAAAARGMRSLRSDALDKALAGLTSLDEVDRVVV